MSRLGCVQDRIVSKGLGTRGWRKIANTQQSPLGLADVLEESRLTGFQTAKQTSVSLAVFSASRDSATKQLSGLSWRGFVSWKRVEKNRLVMVQFGSDGFYVAVACVGSSGSLELPQFRV